MGTLFIVGTPIGNLKDMTFRAVEIIASADYVLCEDTRVSGRLLNHFKISNKLVVLNDFNEEKMVEKVINDLLADSSIVLVSDAGMPLISDPGYKLVREAVARSVRIEAIPGATAATTALAVSGLPTDKFLFLGFLPKKDGKRLELLKNTKDAISKVKSTVIIYESPYRVLKLLEEIQSVFGDIDIVVCRELTKMHEEIIRGKISEIHQKVKTKGEFVVLF